MKFKIARDEEGKSLRIEGVVTSQIGVGKAHIVMPLDGIVKPEQVAYLMGTARARAYHQVYALWDRLREGSENGTE